MARREELELSKPQVHPLLRGVGRLLPLFVLLLLALLGPSSALAAGGSEEETAAAPAAVGEEAQLAPPPAPEIPILQVEVALPPLPVEAPPVLPVVEHVAEQVVEPIATPVTAEAPEAPGAVGLKDPEGVAENPTSQSPTEIAQGQAPAHQAPQLPSAVQQTPMPPTASAAPPAPPTAPSTVAVAKNRSAAAKRARQATCALSSLGAAMTADCVRGESGGWLVAQTPPASFPPSAALAAIAVRSGARHAKNRSPENRLSIPPPGRAPSGGDEGPAAGGAGSTAGAAVAAVALLLLSVPYVTRRLRILRRSWRTSFFVLIPERPG